MQDTAMQKMAQSHVFLSGVGGLGVEIGKFGYHLCKQTQVYVSILPQLPAKAYFRCNKNV